MRQLPPKWPIFLRLCHTKVGVGGHLPLNPTPHRSSSISEPPSAHSFQFKSVYFPNRYPDMSPFLPFHSITFHMINSITMCCYVSRPLLRFPPPLYPREAVLKQVDRASLLLGGCREMINERRLIPRSAIPRVLLRNERGVPALLDNGCTRELCHDVTLWPLPPELSRTPFGIHCVGPCSGGDVGLRSVTLRGGMIAPAGRAFTNLPL
jgi:hypothetical protein